MSNGWLGNKQVYPSPELKNERTGEVEYTAEEGLSFFQYTCIQLAKGLMPKMAGVVEERGLAEMVTHQAVHLILAIEDAQERIHGDGPTEFLKDQQSGG